MPSHPTRLWRIAHAESSLGWGGQEHRILAELNGFRRRGSAVWLLALRASEVFRRAAAAGLAVQPLATSKLQFPFAVVQTARWLRRHQIQIAHPHSSRAGWIVGLAARLARVPFLLRSRHFDVPSANRWLSGFVFKQLADHVVPTSPKVTAHFREYFGLPAERVSTVPTGIDLELFAPEGPRAELGVAAGRPVIGMIAVLRQAKGHATLLEAACHLRDAGWPARYVFVGDGPQRDALQQQVRTLGLADSVTFTGHREDIPATLRALNLLVMPSLHEGIPPIGRQALATRTPVVGSDAGGIPSIIEQGVTGRIFPAGDAVALARAIRTVFDEPAATEAMTAAGRTRVAHHHSLAGMIDALYRRHFNSQLNADALAP